MTTSMNILMISTDRSLFEADSAVRERLLEQSELVGTLHVVVLGQKGVGAKKEKVSKRLTIHNTNSANRFAYMTDAYSRSREIIATKRGKWVVTAQDPFWTGVVGYIVARKHEAAFHVQLHTDIFSPGWKGNFLRRLLAPWVYLRDINELRFIGERLLYPMALFLIKHADAVRVISERLRTRVQALGVPPERITKVPIYTETKKLKIAPASFDLHQTYREYQAIVLSIGRLEPEKNYHGLIRAFRKVVKDSPDTLLLIVGSGAERDRLMRLARSLNLERHVKILPWARDVVSYYKTCDVYVQPSLYEGWGLSVVEAMASGVPVVMSDVGCAGELLKHEESGLVVPPGEESLLAEAIIRLLRDRELSGRLSQKATEAVESLATKEETLRLYKESWEKAVSKSQVTSHKK